MVTIENRSPYTVSANNRDDLHREFPFTQLAQAKQYAIELGKYNYKPYQCRRKKPKASLNASAPRNDPRDAPPPFANIQTTDIEDYIKDRRLNVKPSTVDRGLDVIRAIFTVAAKV